MADVLQIFTTVADRDAADRIASALIEQRLAACVQILGPMKSVFRWQGKIDSSEEWLCIVKTRASRYAAVEAASPQKERGQSWSLSSARIRSVKVRFARSATPFCWGVWGTVSSSRIPCLEQ